MDKIPDIFHHSYLDPKIKKNKSKKHNKLSDKDTIFKEKSTFEEIFETTVTDIDKKEIDLQEKKLENLLKEIGSTGEKLKKSKLLEDLNSYKVLIKEYLSLVLSLSEKTEKKTIWDKTKKEKITKVHIKIINQELLDLTKLFFSGQQNTFTIAAKIDKIEGLLIDLKS